MTQSVGVDIENVFRFTKELENKPFLNKIFTKQELDYCFSKSLPEQPLAARFAAKEAVSKALGSLGFTHKNFSLKDIEIKKKENGAPSISIKNLDPKYKINISISHTAEQAIAFCIINLESVPDT
jgi:holo-[acyl-carrier protein] synthase